MLDCNTLYHNILYYHPSIVVFIITPTELLKIQMQNTRHKFASMSHLSREIYNKEGIKGFYRGYWVTFNRDCYTFGIYFYTYFQLIEYLESKNSLTTLKQFIIGGFAGAFSWAVGFHFDPIKTLIQSDRSEKTMTQLEAAKSIYATSGIKGFFRGFNSVMVMAFCRHSVIFTVNGACLNLLNQYI